MFKYSPENTYVRKMNNNCEKCGGKKVLVNDHPDFLAGEAVKWKEICNCSWEVKNE
jgi:hypothetical protein